MEQRTPLTVITGPLGSGKTTLLRHILATVSRPIAILMNEFGEIAIDTQILQGKNVKMADLGGGCVCCSLLGEFEAAVDEIINTVQPEQIVVETTGLAEPDSLVFNVQESLPQVRLDGVIAIMDADAMVKFPHVGHTTRLQIEAADLLLLNKVDLAAESDLADIRTKLTRFNDLAPIISTQQCKLDPELLFGLGHQVSQPPSDHVHETEFDAFSHTSHAIYDRSCFEEFVENLSSDVYRAKGFIQFPEGGNLFNFVAGRWELEPFTATSTELVFIGNNLASQKATILDELKSCEQQN